MKAFKKLMLMSTAFLCMAAVGCSQKQESKSESSEPSSTPASSEVSSVASSEESPSSISVSISSEESSSEESSIESSSSEEIISSSSEEEISSSETIPPTPKIPEANVFVLSGQSNMQGNSICSEANLRQAFEDLGFDDYDEVAEGMDSVLTSVYCAGYGELDHTKLEQNSRLQSYTNPDNQFAGKFVPTVPGFGDFNGTKGTKMGPEFGAAYYLREYVDDAPIFFIKMASNGSGFAQSGTQYNWPVKDTNGDFPEINLYSTFCKPFIENNLALIEDMGYNPVIRGWLWHQGESDSATEKIQVYAQRLGDMVAQFREDFEDYAPFGDGDEIAFIDGMIYQGEGTAWGKDTSVAMNEAKQAFADSGENNYIVDIYANEEPIPENELKPGQPGGDSMHYNTKSCLRLGMAYGKVIVDNDLLW